jgi:maleylpyruvate isomerase
MKLALYSYWRSTSSWRVRIGLELKGLAYEYRAVNLLADEQYGDAHKERNPTSQVPVLDVDGRLIAQSLPILEWLEDSFPEVPILPRDPYARARARQLAEYVNSGIQPYQNMQIQRQLGETGPTFAAARVKVGLDALEVLVAQTAGKFAVGDAPTIADCCIVPQLFGARRMKVDVAPYTRLLAIESTCAALAPFQRAHADAQPDALVKDKP